MKNTPGAALISLLFFMAISGAEWMINRTLFLNALCTLLSAVTFIAYAIDKHAAKKAHQRTPEAHLHLLSLFGGWPGAMLAQQILRHKSQKTSFRFIYWLTVGLNCSAIGWLLTPTGLQTLRTFCP